MGWRAAVIGFVVLAVAAAPAQLAKGRAAPTSLDGVWTNGTITPLERPAEFGSRLVMTEAEARAYASAHAIGTPLSDDPREQIFGSGVADPEDYVMRVDGQPRTSLITTPTGRAPPARPRSTPLQAVLEGRGRSTDNPESRSLDDRCLAGRTGPLLLPLLRGNVFQFVQTADEVAILSETMHDVRHVRLKTTTHLPASVRPWMGDAIGRWEGATLVVETTNVPQVQAFRGAWETLKVTERFTRRGPARLLYQFVVEDPTIWDQPWGGEFEFRPAKGPVYEYACHEGNYTLEGILAGARQEEAKPLKVSAPR